MKIAIDARGINWYKGTGIGTYTDRILNYMMRSIAALLPKEYQGVYKI